MISIRHAHRFAALALLLFALAFVAPHAFTPDARAGETYRVFCVNGKIDFGTRALKDMKWDYGDNVCVLAEFNNYTAAREDARRRGGVGAGCDRAQCKY